MRFLVMILLVASCRPQATSQLREDPSTSSEIHARLVGPESPVGEYTVEVSVKGSDTSGGISLHIGEADCGKDPQNPIDLLADESRPTIFHTFSAVKLIPDQATSGFFCVVVKNGDGVESGRTTFVMTKNGGGTQP